MAGHEWRQAVAMRVVSGDYWGLGNCVGILESDAIRSDPVPGAHEALRRSLSAICELKLAVEARDIDALVEAHNVLASSRVRRWGREQGEATEPDGQNGESVSSENARGNDAPDAEEKLSMADCLRNAASWLEEESAGACLPTDLRNIANRLSPIDDANEAVADYTDEIAALEAAGYTVSKP